MESCRRFPSESAVHTQQSVLEAHPSGSVATAHSVLLLGCPWCGQTLHPLNTGVVSSIGLLGIKLPCTSVCRFLGEKKFSVLWGKCPRVELGSYRSSSHGFKKTISQSGYISQPRRQYRRASASLHPWQRWLLSPFLSLPFWWMCSDVALRF